MPGKDELTRVLRELFDRSVRSRQSPQGAVVILKGVLEEAADADRIVLDGTQPSGSPKWGDAATWSRSLDNILWSEGAQWL